jgi:hypothetical protein
MMSTNRQSTLGLPRKSAVGAASSHGRLFKVLGDLFLISGRTEDATIWCVLPACSNFAVY